MSRSCRRLKVASFKMSLCEQWTYMESPDNTLDWPTFQPLLGHFKGLDIMINSFTETFINRLEVIEVEDNREIERLWRHILWRIDVDDLTSHTMDGERIEISFWSCCSCCTSPFRSSSCSCSDQMSFSPGGSADGTSTCPRRILAVLLTLTVPFGGSSPSCRLLRDLCESVPRFQYYQGDVWCHNDAYWIGNTV